MKYLSIASVLALGATTACTSPEEMDELVEDGAEGKADDLNARAWRGVGDVFGVPNLDDDNLNGRDWGAAPSSVENDLSALVFPRQIFDNLAPGRRIKLSLSSGAQGVRIWRGTKLLLGAGATTTSTILATAADGNLRVEFADYDVRATLTVTEVTNTNVVVDTGKIALRASPLIVNHHLQPTERVWSLSVAQPGFNNQAMVNAYSSVLGTRYSKINGSFYGFDVWVQDEIEFATATGAGGERLDVVIDSIRNRGLDTFPESELVKPGTIAQTWGSPFETTTFDSFGNLEASPPITVNGLKFPFGRIYYGKFGGTGLNDTLADFLGSQAIQAPIEINTTWLCVGHVDEIISFVPDKSSPKGFKLLLADVPAALSILSTLPATRSLPKYQFDHGYATVGSMRSDANLIAENQDIQADYLDPIRAQLKAELGLTEADIIRVPSLFEPVQGCGGYVALIPGMVNLIVANPPNSGTHLFIPDPFFRTNLADQASDPILSAFANSLPDELQLHFVDDWDVYHMSLGEVHCGTNVRRTPTAQWWKAN